MSTHHHNDNHGKPNELVEGSGIKAKPILVFLIALGAATAMVFVIIKGLQYGFNKIDEMDRTPPGTQLSAGTKLPPEPRLQGAPEPDPNNPGQIKMSALPLDDMAAERKRVAEKAAGYEWVDKQGGIARIPIEEAKKLIAEKGLPQLGGTAVADNQTAEKVRRDVLNSDSNAGRGLKSLKPVATVAAPTASPSPTPAAPAAQSAAEAPKPAAAAAGAKH
ncbi:MAG TPA: hypothetical protein PLD20_29640 [Blastocatellia bacterium]|nr:hypothetical protein [Blastocatellia bacterium]HMV82636.1 hypothetical protein [Blastocatellia bacterium]HMX25104.1 hypothetical protein [Blastocatellia bacterium]HMY72636.1 hypothetical protein [Blastocatellia bacterium]HMZ22132.1 hypothetical protein [Blastocatellia bacterium]